ncbi:NYN domain-containing protein [Luteimonas sp. MC1825]|uniref:NYN domain-containing protein n=1 Tax=Luteimonas sp. MC1825 TaxID=2761107 RepID=UPI00161D288E|nr:NYN domain-containing protein [Luteimonas sp. MC1825]MBB6600369.1 NYN domain-containing protein [Luteimonas sp. MC1825]QOC88044.1 NYN domain-containing protein [Luteimonas sp. MC1825]
MAEHEKRIAVLIDADNAPAAKIDAILAEVARHGVANVRRAYGNWKSQHLVSWEKCLHTYAIRPIQQFAYTTGKNASDMAMVIDAMDLLYAGNLDGFAIVSSDADFTPLVMRLRNDGVAVYGFGQEKTPEPFVKACSTFLYLEKLGTPDEDSGDARPAPSPAQLQHDADLVRLLRGAVDATQGEDGWSKLGAVGSHVGNQGSFDSRNHGYRKLSDLIEAIGLFEVRRQGQVIEVRNRSGHGGRRGASKTVASAGVAVSEARTERATSAPAKTAKATKAAKTTKASVRPGRGQPGAKG